MPTIDIEGTRLYYEDTGPSSTGETIAWSHGLLWNHELFAPQIAALRGRYRCISWDHRGQGKSAADHRHSIGIELVWQDAVAVLTKVASGPVHFCGLSMGGFVGMRMAARRPDLVRSLILIATAADEEPVEGLARYRLMARVARVVGPRLVAPKIAPVMFGKTFLGDPARQAERERYIGVLASRRDIWRAVNGVLDRAPIVAELARIAAPTLVLSGEEDLAITTDRSARIASGIDGARFVRIPRAGHSLTVEEPDAVISAIESFLESLSQPRAPAQREA